MREVTVYEATDGTRHDTPDLAIACDAKLAAIADAMWGLGERPRESDPAFSSGRAYVQHHPEVVARSKAAIAKLFGYPFSCIHALSEAKTRLRCIDPSGREWTHPGADRWPGAGTAVELRRDAMVAATGQQPQEER